MSGKLKIVKVNGSKSKSETGVPFDHTLSPHKWSLPQKISKSSNDEDNSLNKADTD